MNLHTAYISLGSNLGDRLKALGDAISHMAPEIFPLAYSKIYETPPWGYEDQPPFLNQVVKVETNLSPFDLLNKLKDIENFLGRKPGFRYGPRLIDLDILFFDDLVLSSNTLTIPHPEIENRAFVLIPLVEIASSHIHPVNHKTIEELAIAIKTDTIHVFKENSQREDHV